MSKEEAVLVFYENGDEHPRAIMHSNSSHTFYRLKKMNREEISSLLGVDNKVS